MTVTTSSALVDHLRDALGSDAVLTDASVTESYSQDMMPLADVGTPLAVVLPSDTEGVQAVVRACAAAGVPIVPRGAGSG
ncbi:MAG: FAD-binding oxidoreductase, partial [Sciscionella sp.]